VRAAALVALALAACGPSAPPKPTGIVSFTITDDDSHDPIPARVALFDAQNQLVHFGDLDLYGQRQTAGGCESTTIPGMLATWTGLVLPRGVGSLRLGRGFCMLRPGKYRVVAFSGIEYDRAEATLDTTETASIEIELHRAFTPTGVLAADLHVHGTPSDDSMMPDAERVAGQVAAGIQVIGFANHNESKSLAPAIAQLGLGDRVASIAGMELTSDALHLGVYPVPVDTPVNKADVILSDVAGMFAVATAMPGHPIIQVNHPRFRYGALFDLVQWNDTDWPPPFPLDFDALEVVAGYQAFDVPGDRRTDDTVADLYALVQHGKAVAAMGNSDTHDFTWVLDGTARTYVTVPHPTVAPFDEAAFLAAIRARKTLATTCPYLTVRLEPDDRVAIDVAQANFCHATHVELTVDRHAVASIPIPAGSPLHWEGAIPGLPHDRSDAWLGVTASGDAPIPLEQTGSYQQDKWKHPGVVPYAVISPLLLDRDGDGHWKYGGADLLVDALRQ
jgi:hypothetical protein